MRTIGWKERKGIKKSFKIFLTDDYEFYFFFYISLFYVGASSSMGGWLFKICVDVPDSSCHWYVAAPDNTLGEGFNWENGPWFDANEFLDVAKTERESVVEKPQNNWSFYFIN